MRKNKPKKSGNVSKPESRTIVYRNRLKPKTIHQNDYIHSMAENTITFCHGPAGSGKTHIAVGLALEYLLENKVNLMR